MMPAAAAAVDQRSPRSVPRMTIFKVGDSLMSSASRAANCDELVREAGVYKT